MNNVLYTGGTFVKTEAGNVLSVEPTVGHLVLSNGTRVQVKRAWVVAVSNDTTALIPAVADAVFRVIALRVITGSVAPTVTFKSGTTAIQPPLTYSATGGECPGTNLWGHMQTLAMNEALNVTVSSSADVAVIVNYIEITDDLFDLL
jgi:hypothetical protein